METATEKSSDDASTSNYCKPCLRDKTYETAVVYCCECSELLCSECKKHHSKNKLTTTHTVVDMNGDPGETAKLNYVKNLTKCTKHQLEEVKYLCKDHNQLCCNECAILEHRKCRSLVSISDWVASGYEKRHKENLDKIEKHIENLKSYEKKKYQRTFSSELMIKNQLTCIKAEFDHAFNEFEKGILLQVRSKCDVLRNSISSQQSRIDRFEAALNLSKEKITSVEQYGQNLHMYLAEREMEKEMEHNEQNLQELQTSTNRTEISLEGTEHISNHLKKLLTKNLSVKEFCSSDAPNFPNLEKNQRTELGLTINGTFIRQIAGSGMMKKKLNRTIPDF